MIRIHSLEFDYRNGEFRLNVPEFKVKKSEKVAMTVQDWAYTSPIWYTP